MTVLASTLPSGHKAGIWACFIVDRNGFSIALLSVSESFQFGAVGVTR